MKTYNFIEACNSGKKFGFKDRPYWHIANGYDEFEETDFWFSHLVDHAGGAQIDIINGVFVLEEKKIEITESQFNEVAETVGIAAYGTGLSSRMKKLLGFYRE